MKAPKILDNKGNGTVYKELQENIKKGSKVSIISAYFSMYAYSELKKDLDKIDDLRFIFTKPSFIKNKEKKVREYFIDNHTDNSIFGNEFEIKLRNEMNQSSIAKDCTDWLREKSEIKSFKTPNEAQPRMICIENNNSTQNDESDITISGTVDFTTAGLGINPSNRPDSIICNYGKDFTKSSLMIFENIWNNNDFLEDVKKEVLEQMEVMYTENPAEFVYFVSMYNIFNDSLDELNEDKIVRKGNQLKESQIWNKLYKFQKDAAIGAIDKIEKHNGCILADSVGLGKTFTALAIIKYYELRNDRVLVLVPKKLRDNWTVYTQNDKRNIFVDDRFNFDVLNHTDLSRDRGKSGEIDLQTINWGNYDLVVIDESHNFRNNPAVKDRQTRYEKLMNEVIKSGHKTRLLMLSATPVNNRMNDIKNQIAFITEEKDNSLEDIGINSIEFTLRKAQGVFNQWSKEPEEYRTGEAFVDQMDMDYFKLLDALTIARSRKHIEKYYDLNEIGHFPIRKDPINIHSEIDNEGWFPPLKDVNNDITKLNLGIFAPFHYILPAEIDNYNEKYDMEVAGGSTFKQYDRDTNIISLMRVNLLKRMESSIESFRLTISRLLYKIDNVLNKIENKKDYNPDIDINLIDPEEEEYDDQMFGNKRKVLLQDMDLIKWKQDLELDKEKLEYLLKEAKRIDPGRDEKLQELKNLIKNKINNPINPNNKKVIIFSAFADTAKYLYKNIAEWVLNEFGLYSAIVTGSDTNKTTLKSIKTNDINDILTNFSPISKERASINPNAKEEIDILICTDCISEGQNLQDCDYLINYDIHWNPVRIIQRFGRIDRIGSKNEEIQLVNFWPNMELEEYINLEGRVKNRMVMVDVSATGEENVIADGKKSEMNDLKYRKNQLERLQEEVMDLEDISDAISITDLTFNDFKIELMDYMKDHKEELEKAPCGIYSIVNVDEDLNDEIEPGVIFLLKQIAGTKETQDKNSLTPYYLVYIGEDNEVKLNYVHSKKIMDYYKKLCSGKKEVLKELINEFNEETNDGKDMHKYSDLLVESIENILGKKQETGVKSLFSKGRTAPVKQDIDGLEEFELITFLIVK